MQYNVTVIGSGPGGYIVDGRESVSFLVRVKELLEDPGRVIPGV